MTVCVIATSCGFLYVYWQLQSGTLAKDNKKLETELGEREAKTRRLELERDKLKTQDALEKRLAHFRIEMVPVDKRFGVQVLDAQSFSDSGVSMLARGPRDGRAGP